MILVRAGVAYQLRSMPSLNCDKVSRVKPWHRAAFLHVVEDVVTDAICSALFSQACSADLPVDARCGRLKTYPALLAVEQALVSCIAAQPHWGSDSCFL